ncbi:hypothetical protein [Vibrio coralliilyticus]|uniref:hypothetical protein n=1 Tax=Vibrio coralliilyticus TaxID=190893 RepID=UPI0002E19173|nr:hypothetical protein [Vibrio coralliilyticus]
MTQIQLTIDRNDHAPISPPEEGFVYVDQGNYHPLTLSSGAPLTLYSDSATSCIITFVVADLGEQTQVIGAHLDSPACIEAFFGVIDSLPAKTLQIVAQGANPPDNDTARHNAQQLTACIDALGDKVIHHELFLLEGNPTQDNLGQLGLYFDGQTQVTVSNQPYALELYQRDPTCGGQTVYCIMRRQETPPIQIRNAALPFTHAELVELASIANAYRQTPDDPQTAFTNIVNLQGDVIRQTWSTTPDCEAPWFADQLKLGATFALAMSPVVNLSEQHLQRHTPTTFHRLRRSVLGGQ